MQFNRLILIIFLLLSLSSCSDEDPFPRCVQADDFFTPSLSISASRPKGSNDFAGNIGPNTGLIANPDQVIRWKDTGYKTNGDPIVIRTQGQWTSWDSNNASIISDFNDTFESSSKNTDYEKSISKSSVNKKRCVYKKTRLPYACTNDEIYAYVDIDTRDKDRETPCWFDNGYGAYLLFKRPKNNDPDPNATTDLMRAPISPIVHIGYDDNDGLFSTENKKIFDSACNEIKIEPGWDVYIKILDRFYFDNAGGYSVSFVSGVMKPNNTKVFESIRAAVVNILNGASKEIFIRITQNADYINFVRVLLLLHVMMLGFGFVIGTVKNPGQEIFIRIIKMTLIIQLISPNSWDFFHNYFFVLFEYGLNELIGIVNSGADIQYDPQAPFSFLDTLITDRIFAPTVWNVKMRALMISSAEGFIFVLVIILIVLIYVVFVCYAFVIYLTGYIGITVLIALMPIFFLGILFSFFKQTFESWCTQMLSFVMQSVLLFSLIALFTSLILNSYYRTLGFTSCYNTVWEFTFSIGGLKIADIAKLKNWSPGHQFKPFQIGILGNYDLDIIKRYTFEGGKKIISPPPDYNKNVKSCRYVDFPYFDPQYKLSDCTKIDPIFDCVTDKQKESETCLNSGSTGFAVGSGTDYEIIRDNIMQGRLIIYIELFVTLLIVIVIYHMRVFVQKLGAAIAGASPFTTVIGIAYEMRGSLFAFIDQQLTGLRITFADHISNKFGEKIGNILTKRPGITDNLLVKGIKSTGNVVGRVGSAASWIFSTESEITRYYREKEAFKEIDYAKAVIGSHLPSAASGLHAAKALAEHVLDKKVLGIREDGLLDVIRKNEANRMEKLHDNILGYKPRTSSIGEDKKKDEENPFEKKDGTPETSTKPRGVLKIDEELINKFDNNGDIREKLESYRDLKSDGKGGFIIQNENDLNALINYKGGLNILADRIEGQKKSGEIGSSNINIADSSPLASSALRRSDEVIASTRNHALDSDRNMVNQIREAAHEANKQIATYSPGSYMSDTNKTMNSIYDAIPNVSTSRNVDLSDQAVIAHLRENQEQLKRQHEEMKQIKEEIFNKNAEKENDYTKVLDAHIGTTGALIDELQKPSYGPENVQNKVEDAREINNISDDTPYSSSQTPPSAYTAKATNTEDGPDETKKPKSGFKVSKSKKDLLEEKSKEIQRMKSEVNKLQDKLNRTHDESEKLRISTQIDSLIAQMNSLKNSM